MRFGKDKPKRSLKSLALSNYMRASAVPFPPVHAWERAIDYRMLKNDMLGDCVIAGVYHLEMNWQAVVNAGTPLVPTDEQAIADYAAVAGYVPGDPSTDNGTNMLDAMHYGLRKGYAGRPTWQTFATLDIHNVDQIKAATYLFGGVPLGFSVPQSMIDEMNQGLEPTFKFVPNDKPSGEGHCITALGYGRGGFAACSWGKIFRVSWDFWLANVDEGYGIVSTDWLKASGVSPTGLDLMGLIQDSAAL